MIDAFFKGIFMIVVLHFWIWLGRKLWKVVEMEEQEDEDRERFLTGIRFSDMEKKED